MQDQPETVVYREELEFSVIIQPHCPWCHGGKSGCKVPNKVWSPGPCQQQQNTEHWKSFCNSIRPQVTWRLLTLHFAVKYSIYYSFPPCKYDFLVQFSPVRWCELFWCPRLSVSSFDKSAHHCQIICFLEQGNLFRIGGCLRFKTLIQHILSF